MLNVLGPRERYDAPCALLLGGFDGLHRGHARLLYAAKSSGLAVGLTSFYGIKAGGELFTAAERREIFADAGLSFAAEYVFDDRLRATSAQNFLHDLFGRIAARAAFCGEDFRFGRGAQGTPALLVRLAPCPVSVLPLLDDGGEKISASRVKRAVAEGNMAEAARLLLTPYFAQGTVEHGRHVGGPVLGFPTLNVTLPAEKLPPKEGVYGGTVQTPLGEFPAIINFGARPTFGVTEKKAEAYLHGFHGDLYGAVVRIYPREYFRPVMRFSSPEALREQLERDKERLLHVL